MRYLVPTLVALGLSACGQQNLDEALVESKAGYYSAEADMAAPAPRSRTQASEPSGTFLAYRYGYGLELPASAVKPTADKHMQACQNAGPSKCQIMGSSSNNFSDDNIRANLSLRAEPDWLKTFVAEMRQDIETSKGRLTSATTSVEDLTRSILDTDARLKAQTTLRTRLEGLLATRNAELPDLLALERELARVQGEIESATANLRALRARVSMSVVDINYASQQQAVSRSAFAPVGVALKNFAGTVSQGLSGVINFIAVTLPWFLFIILPGFFLIRWLWRKRKLKT